MAKCRARWAWNRFVRESGHDVEGKERGHLGGGDEVGAVALGVEGVAGDLGADAHGELCADAGDECGVLGVHGVGVAFEGFEGGIDEGGGDVGVVVVEFVHGGGPGVEESEADHCVFDTTDRHVAPPRGVNAKGRAAGRVGENDECKAFILN